MTSMPSPRPAETTGVDLTSLERVPPHDLAAEQSVLGAMMISADAIADVTETLQPGLDATPGKPCGLDGRRRVSRVGPLR